MSSSINLCGRPATNVNIDLHAALGLTQRYRHTPPQRLRKDCLAIRQRRPIFEYRQPILSSHRIDFCLCAFEHHGMLHHGEDELRHGRDGLFTKALSSSCFHVEIDGGTYGVNTSLRVVSNNQRCQRRVPDLPAYIELAVHLKSKSCRGLNPFSLPSISSSTVEMNDAFAVPLRCSKRHQRHARQAKKSDCTLSFKTNAYGSSTNSSIFFFQMRAFRLNPAPGNQSGKCFTRQYVCQRAPAPNQPTKTYGKERCRQAKCHRQTRYDWRATRYIRRQVAETCRRST